MALNIEGATLGYDANNIRALLNDMNTNVIQETISKMGSGLGDLDSHVDEVWVGASAKNFKNNMSHDKDVIAAALRESYVALEGELNQIVNKMDELDRNLVQERG